MLTYILRRLAYVPLPVFVVVVVTFLILRLTGNPVDLYLDISRTPEQVQALTERLHLDKPLPVQFGIYLRDLLRGDFGTSLQFGGPAMPVVLERLGATLQLASIALVLSIVLGVTIGFVCAVNKDRLPDVVLTYLAAAGQSMPSFWLGLLLIQFFSLHLGWVPTSGVGSAAHFVLPVVTVMSFVLPNFVLVSRASVLEVIGEQYVTTARAKGLSPARTLITHVLPNVLNPILSLVGLEIGRLMGGSIITETIFAWPGVGRLMVGAIFQRDLPVVVASVFILSVLIVLASLLIDLINSLIDPRIRLR